MMTDKIAKRWRVTQEWLDADPCGKRIPAWARHLAFGGYGHKGWAAFDQRNGGKRAATGRWGDELRLLRDGRIACTEYPEGWSVEAAVEKGRLALERNPHGQQ